MLLLLAHDPGMRLRDIAARLGITERSAYRIASDLTGAGYLVKQKGGRLNRYQIQVHLPLPEPTSRERTIDEVLAVLAGRSRAFRGRKAEGSDAAPGHSRIARGHAVAVQVRLVARTLPGKQFDAGRMTRVRIAAGPLREGINLPTALGAAGPGGDRLMDGADLHGVLTIVFLVVLVTYVLSGLNRPQPSPGAGATHSLARAAPSTSRPASRPRPTARIAPASPASKPSSPPRPSFWPRRPLRY